MCMAKIARAELDGGTVVVDWEQTLRACGVDTETMGKLELEDYEDIPGDEMRMEQLFLGEWTMAVHLKDFTL